MANSPLTYGPKVSSGKSLPDGITPYMVIRHEEANAMANRVSEKVSVLEAQFGSAQVDVFTSAQASLNATALANALQAAAGKAIVEIPGTLFLPATYTFGNTIPVPANSILDGHGRSGIIKIDPASLNANGDPAIFQLTGSNITLRDFQFDGSRGSVAGPTSLQVYGFARGVTTAIDGLVVDGVWAHDLPSVGGQESFVVTLHVPGLTLNAQLSGAVTNVTFRHLRGWNCGGTPFHCNGSIDESNLSNVFGGFMLDGVTVHDVWCWGNDVQGISCYGAKNVVISNCKFWNNANRGINLEWSDNIWLHGNDCHGNYNAGIGTSGLVNFKAERNHLWGNNTQTLGGTTPASGNGEFTSYSSNWGAGSPKPTSHLGTAIIRNNIVEPLSGGRHYYFDRLTTVNGVAINIGDPIPASITFDQPDIDSWKVGDGSSSPIISACTKHQGGPASLHTVGIGRLIDMTPSSGSITIAAYAGTGNNNTGAVTLTSNTQFTRAEIAHGCLRPGRTYRVRTRIKAEDTNAEWDLRVTDGTNVNTVLSHFAVASQVGVWKNAEFILNISTAWAFSYFYWWRNTAAGTSSSFDIDYCNVEELSSQTGMSETPTWAGRVVGRGTAAPTTGTWRQNDIWLSDNAAASGFIGWVCVTAGTPGTWKTWGAISA